MLLNYRLETDADEVSTAADRADGASVEARNLTLSVLHRQSVLSDDVLQLEFK